MVIDIDKSIEDWMENGNIRHDSCRWLIPNDIDGNCPLSDSRNVPTIKKKKIDITTTRQPTEEHSS